MNDNQLINEQNSTQLQETLKILMSIRERRQAQETNNKLIEEIDISKDNKPKEEQLETDKSSQIRKNVDENTIRRRRPINGGIERVELGTINKDMGTKLLISKNEERKITTNEEQIICTNVNECLKEVNDESTFIGNGQYCVAKLLRLGSDEKFSSVNDNSAWVQENVLQYELGCPAEERIHISCSGGSGFVTPVFEQQYEDVSKNPNKELLVNLTIDINSDKSERGRILNTIRSEINNNMMAIDYTHRLLRMALVVLHFYTCEENGYDKFEGTNLNYRHRSYSIHVFDNYLTAHNATNEQVVACSEEHLEEYYDFCAISLLTTRFLKHNTIYSRTILDYENGEAFDTLSVVTQRFTNIDYGVMLTRKIIPDALTGEICLGYLESYARILGVSKHVGKILTLASTIAYSAPDIRDLKISGCRGETDFLFNLLSKHHRTESKIAIDVNCRNVRLLGAKLSIGSIYYLNTVTRLASLVKRTESDLNNERYAKSLEGNNATAMIEGVRAEMCIVGRQCNVLQYIIGRYNQLQAKLEQPINARNYYLLMTKAPEKTVFAELIEGVKIYGNNNISDTNRFKNKTIALMHVLIIGRQYTFTNYQKVENSKALGDYGNMLTQGTNIIISKRKWFITFPKNAKDEIDEISTKREGDIIKVEKVTAQRDVQGIPKDLLNIRDLIEREQELIDPSVSDSQSDKNEETFTSGVDEKKEEMSQPTPLPETPLGKSTEPAPKVEKKKKIGTPKKEEIPPATSSTIVPPAKTIEVEPKVEKKKKNSIGSMLKRSKSKDKSIPDEKDNVINNVQNENTELKKMLMEQKKYVETIQGVLEKTAAKMRTLEEMNEESNRKNAWLAKEIQQLKMEKGSRSASGSSEKKKLDDKFKKPSKATSSSSNNSSSSAFDTVPLPMGDDSGSTSKKSIPNKPILPIKKKEEKKLEVEPKKVESKIESEEIVGVEKMVKDGETIEIPEGGKITVEEEKIEEEEEKKTEKKVEEVKIVPKTMERISLDERSEVLTISPELIADWEQIEF